MNAFEWTFELRFTVALALGFLVGLERESTGVERKSTVFAGVRTYSLISLYGFACGWLYHINVALALPVGMISIAALVLVSYYAKLRGGRLGWTSEVAALLTFLVGALALLTDIWVSMALAIISTLLLSEKAEIENYVERLNKSEFLAVIKFILVTAIILPVLPNHEYSQFKLNPTTVWKIVILVSSLGFVGYLLMKKFGGSRGMWLSGLLGGIVSSTAVSVSAGRIARRTPEHSGGALQAALLASSVMHLRILALIWFLNPVYVTYLWWKLVLLAGVGIVMAPRILTRETTPKEIAEVETLQNPFEIKPAMAFAVFFVLISVATMLIRDAFGSAGVLALSGLVGVTDINPFILSLINNPSIERLTVSAVIVATMSNTIAAGVYFGGQLQTKSIRNETFLRYSIWALAHLPFIFL
ncbi:MAG TPA: MgtC/SapB family protein [Bacteroidota bacterium]|nr:MgtC/SapB family protein [Bacteroidota bacterium]